MLDSMLILKFYAQAAEAWGVQRGAFSPTSGATPATPTLGATPKFLSATPKDFVPSEKAKRSLLLLQNI